MRLLAAYYTGFVLRAPGWDLFLRLTGVRGLSI